jgi:hypothetical protein
MRKNMVDMAMKIKFIIVKYSQVFNRVGPGYGGLVKFKIVGQYVGFPGEGCNFSFTEAEFHTVRSAPTLYRVDVRL